MQPSDFRITDKMREAVWTAIDRVAGDPWFAGEFGNTVDAIIRAVLDAVEVTPEMVERGHAELIKDWPKALKADARAVIEAAIRGNFQ